AMPDTSALWPVRMCSVIGFMVRAQNPPTPPIESSSAAIATRALRARGRRGASCAAAMAAGGDAAGIAVGGVGVDLTEALASFAPLGPPVSFDQPDSAHGRAETISDSGGHGRNGAACSTELPPGPPCQQGLTVGGGAGRVWARTLQTPVASSRAV